MSRLPRNFFYILQRTNSCNLTTGNKIKTHAITGASQFLKQLKKSVEMCFKSLYLMLQMCRKRAIFLKRGKVGCLDQL